MTQAANPFFEEFATVHHTPPFSEINNSQYMEAIDRGIALAQDEIRQITSNTEAPTFENTIVALERSGADLNRVLNVMYPMLSANSDDELMNISLEASAKLSGHSTSIILNEELWKRVKAVYDKRDDLNLDAEDSMLLQKTYDSFALNGADLEGEDRDTFRKLSARLSELTTTFGQNVLKEMNTYEIWLKAEDLTGLPESSVEAAALAAKEKGREGEYLFTLAQPVYSAFLRYSDRPDLRERMWRLYNGRNQSGSFSNLEVMTEIADTRRQLANLLGSKNFAEHTLKRTMAREPEAVYNLLDMLREAYKPAQEAEFAALREYASKLEGRSVDTIHPWDYSYYSNKLKDATYDFNEEELRPYFELGNVVDGVFGLATRLYGITFKENPEIQVYHPDVKAYEVIDSDGSYLGVIYTDFFPRESKRPGAWMTGFRDEWIDENGVNRPHVTIVMNFTKPTADKPSLLTPYEVSTFLHEFGHALHGLFAATKYASMSGTAVYRDFVELPSQLNENFMRRKEFLDSFARHYQTGEPIPAELLERFIASSQYGAAYACLRQLGFGYVDMAWHTITEPVTDPAAFEQKAMESVNMFAHEQGALFSPQFSHIFAGGYASGYYSYKWAEVLDADAFSLFLERGIFDKDTAKSLRDNILSRGGTENPDELYRRFRGKDPDINALLERDGIKAPKAPVKVNTGETR